MNEKIGVFVGTFDPFTNGHLDIIVKAIPSFDRIIIGLLDNPEKCCMFDKEYRLKMIEYLFADNNSVGVLSFDGWAVDFIRMVKGSFFIRGYRNQEDLEYEKIMRDYNYEHSGIDTMLIQSSNENRNISSSMVRKLIDEKKEISRYVPERILLMISEYNK